MRFIEVGVNIFIREYDSSLEVDPIPEWWDSDRLAGDSELAHSESIDWEYFDRDGDGDVTYVRPKDWQQFEAWILENVFPEANRPRWIEAIGKMKANPKLWIEFGW